jgi:diguanylate cyclase (GGDEF)-like protein
MQPMSGDEGRVADADMSAPAARYTKGGPRPPVRRQNDKLGPQTKAPGEGSQRKVGGRLRNEILIPVGMGCFAGFASLGVVAAGVSQVGLPVAPIMGAAGLALIAGLLVYVAWIVNGAAIRPLEDVRTALREMEEGNYDVRLDPIGSAELAELMEGFNQMATIVGHQRERLKLAAATDGLTELANHRHFHERLRAQLQEARDQGLPLAVAAIDIDGFKKLNDERGHARGDEALKLAARALEKAVRGSDLVARLGGDDFIILLDGADSAFARDVTERARAAVMRAIPEDIGLTASAGFVCYPDNAGGDDNLAELAASALDLAKRQGGNQTRKYDPDQVSAIPTIKQQRAEIDEILAKENPITPVFQPLVDLASGRTLGYEALSRFNTDIKRSPDAWFNQAQACGRGLQLELAAIKAALLAPNRPEGSYLSLNFSPSAISSSKILNVLPENLSGIVIEITEHELAAEDGALEEGLARLRARGARIAVDDCGAGYAGLKQLMRAQPDVIKLDRSLIESIHTDKAKTALVEFFVMFARRVGAAVCSEGIETVDELRALVNLGVNYGQGYLLGRPAEPWKPVSTEIARALATGALRTHVARAGAVAGPASGGVVPAAPQAAMGGGPQRRGPQGGNGGASVLWRGSSSSSGAPVNRRLNRY